MTLLAPKKLASTREYDNNSESRVAGSGIGRFDDTDFSEVHFVQRYVVQLNSGMFVILKICA